MHFKRDCPHARHNLKASAFEATTTPDAEAYKVNDYSGEDVEVLMAETANAAVLDSACSKTVAGRAWKEMYLYLASLSDSEKKQVKFLSGRTMFKFGAGNKIQSEGQMEIPCVIGGLRTITKTDAGKTDVVDTYISINMNGF
ncbi:hypothetical protein HOLleu_36466 [Holothuria leucospilota]|uniref:Uncharacterized protein n=1 Tax=Holothuria leucospilota TaxID=206669 RepID=A0A9Q0YRE7_HOLLE|nr:hypothetical protein HOLleu_36466 [Holothuria leucospilota]